MKIIVFDSGIEQPEDRGILLKDIIENATADRDKSYCLDANYYKGTSKEYTDLKGRRQLVSEIITHNLQPRNGKGQGGKGYLQKSDGKSYCLDTGNNQAIEITGGAFRGRNPENPSDRRTGSPTEQRLEINETGKSTALMSVQKDNVLCYAENYIQYDISGKGYNSQQDRLFFKDGKSNTLGVSHSSITNLKETETEILYRKLTPIECERLQTVPDNYTAKGLDIYYYNIIQFIKIVINGDCECKNVKLKDAVIKYRTSLQDCAINIIYDLSDTEQQNLPEIKLINQKNVKLKDAEEIEKQMRDFVCSIIKDSTELAKLNLTKNKNKNANIVIETQLQKDCVINTIRIIEGTETQNIQIKKEKNLINTDIKNLMENMLLSIEKSMKMNTISNYQKMILSIILTLISKIMTLKIFTNVVYPNTQLFISSSIKLQGNLLEVDVSNLKMENISSVSNSQRYKMLGNGWTVEVISHIFSFISRVKIKRQ